MEKKIDIGGELHSVATDHKVADASEIKDISKGNKSQAAFNNDVDRHEVEIHGTGGIDSRLTDVEQIEQIVLDGGEVQIAQGSDFTNPDATKRAKIPTVGAIVDGLNDVVYDISKRNSTGGPNRDGKFTLEYILNNANTIIPTGWKHGGMTISFVQTYDNKYVQYRLMSQTFSTNANDWQGVDEHPTVGSNNLIKSGGVANKFVELNQILSNIEITRRVERWFNTTCNIKAQVYPQSNRLGLRNIVSVNKGTKINIKTNGQLVYFVVFSRSSSNEIYSTGDFITDDIEYTVSEDDCGYYVVLKKEDNSDISPNEALAVVEESCKCNIGHTEKLNLMPIRKRISLTSYIDLDTGREMASQNFACTPDYIEIDSTKIYKLYSFSNINKTVDNVYISMYDENKSFLESMQIIGSGSIIEGYGNISLYKDIDFFMFPLRARYIRVSTYRTEIFGLVISEDYTLSLFPEKITPILIHNMASVSRLGYNSLNVREDLPKYPQGQIVSFIAAKNAGFDTILFNILYTKDGIAVISHEENISAIMAVNKDGSQISGTVKIAEHTLAELQEYDYGLKYGNVYKGLKLLTIDDALKWARMANINIDIEITDGESKERINTIANKIKKYGLEKQCMFFAYYASSITDIPNKLPYAKLHVWGGTSDSDIITAMNNALSLKNSTNQIMVSVNYPTIPSEDTINTLIANNIGFSWGNVSDNNLIIDLFLTHPYLMYASRISTYVEPISLTMVESSSL